ncbi:MAG: hypothetical protein ABIN48_03070 [Ginsengibacter sp.]
MKKHILDLLMVLSGTLLFISCNYVTTSTSEDKNNSPSNTVNQQEMNYPYTIRHPDYWEIGSQQNTMNALSALKAWENKNFDETMKYFADSVKISFDGIDKTLSNDSLKAMFMPDSTMKNWSVKMQDWVSVISKDKMEEYVTLWYREYWESAKGSKDSVDIINDLKMKDGKIIALDQYSRKLNP